MKHAILDHVSKRSKLPASFQKVVDDCLQEKGVDYYLSLVERFEKASQVKGSGVDKIYQKSDIEGINYKWSELSESIKLVTFQDGKSWSDSKSDFKSDYKSDSKSDSKTSEKLDSNNNDKKSDGIIDLTDAVSKTSVVETIDCICVPKLN